MSLEKDIAAIKELIEQQRKMMENMTPEQRKQMDEEMRKENGEK